MFVLIIEPSSVECWAIVQYEECARVIWMIFQVINWYGVTFLCADL